MAATRVGVQAGLTFGTSTWANEPASEAERAKIRSDRDLIRSILNNEEFGIFEKKLHAVSDINFESSAKMTPLHTAAAYGRTQMVSAILSRRPNIEARNSLGFTPLVSAVVNQQEAVVKILISAGAIKTVTTLRGDTPLSIAKASNFASIVSLL